MSIVILDAMEKGSFISKAVVDKCRENGRDISLFELEDMNILPCRSCGACEYKSPGKCVIKDDMHDILRVIAKGSTLIMLTPIRFGGYSSCLKKAVDKFMNLCYPLYTVKHGHLLHSARYGEKKLIAIGAYDGDCMDQEDSFKKLVENNALNLQYEHKSIIIKFSEDIMKIKQKINTVL